MYTRPVNNSTSKCIKILSLLILTAFSVHCTLKKPTADHPVFPSDTRIEKNFFGEFVTDKNGEQRFVSKTFLCGWAPDSTAGAWADGMIGYNYAGHCNVEWEFVDEKTLVAKLVNPSFPNDRNRWETLITIPVNSHFYYERTKDARGRYNEVFTENSSRSHWSARPYVNLNLAGMTLNTNNIVRFWRSGYSINGHEDLEWDFDRNFLGFTLNISHRRFSSLRQARFRFNFLAFEHDENFVPTPYHPNNSKYVNALHIISAQPDGRDPYYYVGKWNTAKKRTVYLAGFPQEYLDIGFETIKQWNDAFEQVDHGRPFVAEVMPETRKYKFDLRYPTITWVDDMRYSSRAPLGVGMTAVDVRNGEILWGSVVVWGGIIDRFVNSYLPGSGFQSMAGGHISEEEPFVQFSLMDTTSLEAIPTGAGRPVIPAELTAAISPGDAVESIVTSIEQNISNMQNRADQLNAQNLDLSSYREIFDHYRQEPGSVPDHILDSLRGHMSPELAAILASPTNNFAEAMNPLHVIGQLTAGLRAHTFAIEQEGGLPSLLGNARQKLHNTIHEDFLGHVANFKDFSSRYRDTSEIFNADMAQKTLSMPTLKQSQGHLPDEVLEYLFDKQLLNSELSHNDLVQAFTHAAMGFSQSHSSSAGSVFDMDYTLEAVLDGWSMGLAYAHEAGITHEKAARTVVKKLLLHEVGHMIGMGHNFKENILPARGTVPNKYLDGYTDEKTGQQFPGLETRAKRNMTNFSTVMGYKNGLTQILIPYDEMNVGPNDILVLEYLYNSRYPVYPVNSTGEEDFSFVNLKAETHGEIRPVSVDSNGKQYHAAFFPSCNNFDSWLRRDPYCSMWTRGYNAVTIMENNFNDLKSNLLSRLNAFTNTVRGQNPRRAEAMLWGRSLMTMSRARVFYDYMRQKYHSVLNDYVFRSGGENVDRILDFSQTCQDIYYGRPATNAKLAPMFEQNAELTELCVANHIMMTELENLLQLPGKDWTVVNHEDFAAPASVFGGDINYNDLFQRFWGTWTELARLPLKVPALYALTTPFPFFSYYGWVIPIHRFSGEDGSYHTSSLYPQEYTSAISAATEMNMNLGGTSLDPNTSMGRTILMLGYLMNNTYYSNDVFSLHTPFINNIRRQAEFRYRWSYILVTRQKDDSKPDKAQVFNAEMRTFWGGSQSESVPEFYIFSDDRTVIVPPFRSLLMPISSIRWLTPSTGIVYGIKLDYTDDFHDRLKARNVRKVIEDSLHEVLKVCTQGTNNNGLAYYFNDGNDDVFPGFDFPNFIHRSDLDKNTFFRSVEEEFRKYYANNADFTTPPTRDQCEEALRGQGLITMTASVINGYFFRELLDYYYKRFR